MRPPNIPGSSPPAFDFPPSLPLPPHLHPLPPPHLSRLPAPPLPPLPRAHPPPATLAPTLPPPKPHNKRGGIIALAADLRREGDDRPGAFLGGAALLDKIDDLLVGDAAADAIADHDHEGVFAGGERGGSDFGLGGDAHAFGGHVAEGAGVGEAGHAFFAEGVGDEGGGVAAEAGGFGGVGGVVVCCQGEGGAGGGGGEEDAGVAAVGGGEGGGGGRVPEGGGGWGGDEGDGGGGAALEGVVGGCWGGWCGGEMGGGVEGVVCVEGAVGRDRVGGGGGEAELCEEEGEVGLEEGVG